MYRLVRYRLQDVQVAKVPTECGVYRLPRLRDVQVAKVQIAGCTGCQGTITGCTGC